MGFWKRPDNYIGQSWDGYFMAAGQHRDSDALERSNFRVILADLESKDPAVEVVREGHWAVGWVEWVAVPPGSPALEAAQAWEERLQDYPVADEDDFSAEELEEAAELWAFLDVEERVLSIQRYGQGRVSIFAARREELPFGLDINSFTVR